MQAFIQKIKILYHYYSNFPITSPLLSVKLSEEIKENREDETPEFYPLLHMNLFSLDIMYSKPFKKTQLLRLNENTT